MQTARMHITFDVPIDRVWAVLIDYAGYARFPGVDSARVLQPGREQASWPIRCAGKSSARSIAS